MQHLVAGDIAGEGYGVGMKDMVNAIRKHTSTIEEELKRIDDMKVVLQRQSTLRPVFGPQMKKLDLQRRKKAVVLRSLIVNALLDYDTLKDLWDQVHLSYLVTTFVEQ